MAFFRGEKFEYVVHGIPNPSNKDFAEHDYDSKEYKVLEWHKEFFSLMLNELGAKGWELVMKWDDSYQSKSIDTSKRVDKLLFKRSSKSEYFGTGFGVDGSNVSDQAKKRSEELHIN
jgi:hypothetical protein